LSPKPRGRGFRVVIDTSVLVAGISGLTDRYIPGKNSSADILHRWADNLTFNWLMTADIFDEYKEVLRRLHVRPSHIGRVVNLIRARAELSRPIPPRRFHPIPTMTDSAFAPMKARRIFL